MKTIKAITYQSSDDEDYSLTCSYLSSLLVRFLGVTTTDDWFMPEAVTVEFEIVGKDDSFLAAAITLIGIDVAYSFLDRKNEIIGLKLTQPYLKDDDTLLKVRKSLCVDLLRLLAINEIIEKSLVLVGSYD